MLNLKVQLSHLILGNASAGYMIFVHMYVCIWLVVIDLNFQLSNARLWYDDFRFKCVGRGGGRSGKD